MDKNKIGKRKFKSKMGIIFFFYLICKDELFLMLYIYLFGSNNLFYEM